MELSLTADDLSILVRSLEHTIQETGSEARRSDTRAYRDRLHWEKRRLTAILAQLKDEEQLAAQSERGFDLQEPEFDFGDDDTASEQNATGYIVSAIMGPR
ncbi:MAG: hypothetical protein JRC77_04295 [Deltaproteobacteria bacterium]|nr:hypothetical protein [Deltaproteobacteria bacterium]